MRVGLLGSLRVTDGDTEIAVRGTKQRALIAVLALHRGAPVPADQLIELLWSDDDLPVNPQNALQAQVATARRALGAEAIETIGAAYGLRFDVAGSEVGTFEGLAAEGRAAAAAGDHPTAADRLADALALWRGPALADFAYEDWAHPERTRLEELRAATIDARIDADLALGRGADLVGEIEALLARDRLREHRWAQLMLALYRSGRQADALRAAGEARRILLEDLGVDPGPELVELEAQILNHDVAPSARPTGPVAAPSARPPLPAPLTRFFGREHELSAVSAALDGDGTRLVTLLGPGGAGKTRLAVELARRGLEGIEADAAFVGLESITDSDAVASAVGAAVGLRRDNPAGSTGVDALQAVASLVADRRLLLVLDNCEHLIGEAARVAELLLRSCPQLTVLATSREPLGVAGERIVPIGPLEPAAAADLFVDRAQAVRAASTIDASAPEIAEICSRLDGLPLAVELAAARANALPISQIADRLAQRFRLLTGGARTAVPRQQTLRAVVDWSYDLLFDDERDLFARLSVFSGGWTLDAAEQICADEHIPAASILDLLAALVDKSLVVVADGPSLRYRMLQTLSEYARERLADRSDAPRLRDRHADWYRGLARQADVGLTSPDAVRWRSVLDAELDNIRGAFDWLVESRRADEVHQLAADIGLLWWLRGDWAEGVRFAERAATVADEAPDALRLMNEAWGAYYRVNQGGDPGEAIEIGRRAVEQLEGLDEPRLSVKAHVALAAMLSRQRDPGLEQAARDAIDVAAAHGDPWFHGVAHGLTALHRIRIGDLEGATDAATRSIEQLESVQDRAAVFEARSVLVTVAQLAGRLDDAEALVDRMAAAACEANVRHYEEWCCTRMGFLRTAQGDIEAGEELHRSALAIGADPWADAHAHLGLAVCARRCGDWVAAREHAGRALAVHERVGAQIEQAYIHIVRAWIEVDQGALEDAQRLADLAEAIVPDAPSVSAMAKEIQAAVAVQRGDDSDARRLLERAGELAPVVGHAAWWLTRSDVAGLNERLDTRVS